MIIWIYKYGHIIIRILLYAQILFWIGEHMIIIICPTYAYKAP